MRNKIIIVFLFTLLIPTHFSFAILQAAGIYGSEIGSQSNPIHIQVDQNPTQAWSNAWDKLRSIQYVSTCASIYKTIKSYSALDVDMSDPASVNSETSYLNYLYSSYQTCVKYATQAQNKVQQSGTLCNGTYYSACSVGKNFVCPSTGEAYCEIPKTNDQICSDQFGKNFKWDGTKNNTGGLSCGCKEGYQANSDATDCVAISNIPAKTNESGLPLGCTSTLGFSATSGVSCGNTKTQAPSGEGSVIAPTSKTEIKEINPVVKKVSEGKTAKSEDSSIVVKSDTANLDQKPTPAVEEVKPKSFWTRLKGWFGF